MRLLTCAIALLVTACATSDPPDVLANYEEVEATSILDAPTVATSAVASENREAIARGEYLVELLGCGACHTDGALLGEPDLARSLAGSRVGIAYTNPLRFRNPGIVFAPNITPDPATGIGNWSDRQITEAVRAGIGRHGAERILVMPWQGYARLSDADAAAIVGYLRHLDPIEHRVPSNVPAGRATGHDYVYFGVYRTR